MEGFDRVLAAITDAAIFMAPIQAEISSLAQILGNFGMVTGLLTNFEKSLVAPIRCNDIDLAQVLNGLPATTTSFPLKYLGLPLGVRRLKRSHFQYLEDKAVARLAPLHGRYFNIAGRKALVKSVLTSQTVYPLTALHVPVEPLQAITKLIRSFFWAGSENATGGKCKVNWTAVCRPTSLGGLGILNMEKFGRALRLRWPWLAWTTPEKPWVGMENPCNEEDMELFHALTKVNIGDGNKASFWHDPWADGLSAKCIAPSIFAMSKKKGWNVRNSIADNAWVLHLDTSAGLSVENLQEFIKLWSHTSQLTLHDDVPDSITWKLTNNGAYSCSSAYKAQFAGTIRSCMDSIIWKVWAPPKCKLFSWLIIQNRVWTADRLAKRGWPNGRVCPLCRCRDETASHLLFQCRFSIRIWKMVKDWLHIHDFHPSSWDEFDNVELWWTSTVLAHGGRKKAMATLFMLVAWELWNERNARTFKHVDTMPTIIFDRIKSEARTWVIAGAKHLGFFMAGE
jgi:hypothetical protein